MAHTEWMIRGPEIATCNCDYSCPCQFNALPTDGTCRAAVAMHIEEGHHGKVKLGGLRWAAVAAWPGPIHMGHGEIQPIVDKRYPDAEAGYAMYLRNGRLAFRLADPGLYPLWYGFEHTAPDLLGEARYGLPELARDRLRGAKLVTNPGCYATATALALAPLLRSGLVLPDGIAVAAMSGVSGAGRKASEDFSFCEIDEDLRAYRLGRHQHVPEIEQTVARFAGRCGPLSFTPHLVPVRRGILATCALRLAPGAAPADLARALQSAYASEPFVRVLPAEKVTVKDVARTNRAHLGVAVDARAGAAVAVSAIDNLVKGAAGQAVQALNAAMGWDEATGLDLLGG